MYLWYLIRFFFKRWVQYCFQAMITSMLFATLFARTKTYLQCNFFYSNFALKAGKSNDVAV